MTKTGIAFKLRHYCTLLAASLLSFVCFSSTSVYLTTDNGLVTCSIDWDTETVTCQSSSSDSNPDCISDLTYYSQMQYNLNTDSTTARNFLEDEISYLKYLRNTMDGQGIQDSLDSVVHGLSFSLSSTSNIVEKSVSLYQHLKSVDCSSCSDGVCPCSNQFAVIESTLSGISDSLVSLSSATNILQSTYSFLTNSFTYFQPYARMNGSYYAAMYEDLSVALRGERMLLPRNRANFSAVLNTLLDNFDISISSVNNYLYKIAQLQLSSISNDVHALRVNFSDYSVVATNFFSFFRDEVSVSPVLEDWTPSDGGYYNFLTNYYLRVVNRDSSLSSTSKTNWFSRIETLLAALVFVDGDSTNTVNISSAERESSEILSSTLDGVSSVASTSSGQLDSFSDFSQNLVVSLRSISASFSRVADPGTVELVSLSSSDSRGSSDSISFETSDIRNLIEACHCATTLCWCFSGLLLLYYFLHWSVKTSYGLLVFAWGVVSAIFRH